MSCHSSVTSSYSANGGGGGSSQTITQAPAAAPAAQQTPVPANAPWDYGDNDGYRNLGHANTYAGKEKIDTYMGWKNGGGTDQWLSSLTSGEKSGVTHYTGYHYTAMNRYLRGQTSSISSADKKAIDGTTAALKKGVLEKPTIFHRGAGAELLGGASTVSEIRAKIGQVIADDGFVSSSASTNNAFSGHTIAYHIKTPAGKGIGAYVRPISDVSNEMEFLFQRKSAFRIAGAYQDANGQVHCNLEYVGNGL